jgi:hypothetical protein
LEVLIKISNANTEARVIEIKNLQSELDESVVLRDSQSDSHIAILCELNTHIEELNTQLSIQTELNEASTIRLSHYSSQIELVAEMVDGGESLALDEDEKDELTLLQEKILGRLREESAKQEVTVAAIGKRAEDSEFLVGELQVMLARKEQVYDEISVRVEEREAEIVELKIQVASGEEEIGRQNAAISDLERSVVEGLEVKNIDIESLNRVWSLIC